MATQKPTISNNRKIIGCATTLQLPDLGIMGLAARVDSGAKTSALWVSSAHIKDGKLAVVFLGKGHALYTGKPVYFDSFTETVVASSNGESQRRFKIKTRVELEGRIVRASFTLADRSSQVYPSLVGRNILRGKFLVDVAIGEPLIARERARTQQLRDTIIGRKKT